MKKLALAAVTLLLAATPAFACPDMESKTEEAAPRTAEKDKAKDAKGQDKAKAAPPKQAEKPKTAKPNEKAPAKPSDKVSSK